VFEGFEPASPVLGQFSRSAIGLLVHRLAGAVRPAGLEGLPRYYTVVLTMSDLVVVQNRSSLQPERVVFRSADLSLFTPAPIDFGATFQEVSVGPYRLEYGGQWAVKSTRFVAIPDRARPPGERRAPARESRPVGAVSVQLGQEPTSACPRAIGTT
jgi:hypothetical protein